MLSDPFSGSFAEGDSILDRGSDTCRKYRIIVISNLRILGEVMVVLLEVAFLLNEAEVPYHLSIQPAPKRSSGFPESPCRAKSLPASASHR